MRSTVGAYDGSRPFAPLSAARGKSYPANLPQEIQCASSVTLRHPDLVVIARLATPDYNVEIEGEAWGRVTTRWVLM